MDLENVELNRRTFFKTLASSSVGLALFFNDDEDAYAGFWTFVGALVVTEVILGVLRAYDIDIGASVESFVRAHKNNSYNRFARGQGAPDYERQISKRGESSSGFCQVGEYGYTTQFAGNNESTIWTPSINMWAATGEKKLTSDLDLANIRCGYPIDKAHKKVIKEKYHKYGFSELTQSFHNGKTKIVIDHSIPETIENIYMKNKNEEVWIS